LDNNGQAGTIFKPGSLPDGRGLIELGNIGTSGSPGWAAGTHIRNIFFQLDDKNVCGIYNWSQDRVRLSDVRVTGPGPNGTGVAYFGSFNSNIVNCYIVEGAFVENTVQGKDTNSTRFHNVTFNTNNPSHPPLIGFGSGWRVTNGIFNAVDGPELNDGLAVCSADASKTGILNSDSRVSTSDVAGGMFRIQWSSCAFVTGGNDVTVFNQISKSEFSSCRFSSSGHTIKNPVRCMFSSCWFAGSGRSVLYKDSGGDGQTTVSSCLFQDFGKDYKEPAIKVENSSRSRYVIVGNAFDSYGNTDNDIEIHDGDNQNIIDSNHHNDGINVEVSDSNIGNSRSQVSRVTNNSLNPIGFSRPTPSLPIETGTGGAVANLYPQGAWVHHNGSGININAFGEIKSLSADSSPVFVPRAGTIYFSNFVPSEWDWWWV
jgi:hypothetical protein